MIIKSDSNTLASNQLLWYSWLDVKTSVNFQVRWFFFFSNKVILLMKIMSFNTVAKDEFSRKWNRKIDMLQIMQDFSY